MSAAGPARLHNWQAAESWRAIDFISDLHLSPDLPQTVAAWAQYVRHSAADAVCMLGDVFETWVGDDSRHLAFEQGLVQAIAQAARVHPIYFMVGNRDFLAGAELCAAAGMQALPDPTRLLAWGQCWVLCHGDVQCLDDKAYQASRVTLRSADFQRQFLALSLADRLVEARRYRLQSMLHQADPSVIVGDLDAQACTALLRQAGARGLIHGHTHRPALHDLGNGLWRQVLSDWNLDDCAAPRAEVLRLSRDGSMRRLSPTQACAD